MATIAPVCPRDGELRWQPLPQVDREASVLEASRLMRRSRQSEVLITCQINGALQPFAILTAAEIVTRVVAAELDPAVLTVGDIAWPEGVVAPVSSGSSAGGQPGTGDKPRPIWTVLDSSGRFSSAAHAD